MKTSKIITTFATLSLIFFMSVTSIANTGTISTGDLVKTGAVAELTSFSIDYLRFDVNNYVDANESEITELPVENEFDYLRFDVNNFTIDNATDLTEMPVNEFEYLRFDVNNYSGSATGETNEMPVM